MKIAFFNRSFHPDVEAVGLLLTELCEELTKRYNISTTVVAGLPYYSENSQYHKKFPFAREHYQGTKILRVWSLSLDKSKTFCRFANYVSFTILSVLAGFRLGKQDIIIAHTNPPTVPIVAFLFAKLYRAKFIYWCKEIFPETANLLKDYHNRHMDNILNRVNRFLFKRADKIVVIGEMMKKRLVEEKGAPEEKITIIRDWARCDRIYPVKESNPFKLKYGLDGKLVIMHSGNIGLAQEVETVVEVAKAFNDRKDIVFLIVGDGARKRNYRKKPNLMV
ncbi:MAG: glycosyltransferase family 4 protein [Candidatus Omnitrophica bacterium]|nr:glycosyltransferase family 4 protein [Candidatus Omnitrophota bacterium]